MFMVVEEERACHLCTHHVQVPLKNEEAKKYVQIRISSVLIRI